MKMSACVRLTGLHLHLINSYGTIKKSVRRRKKVGNVISGKSRAYQLRFDERIALV